MRFLIDDQLPPSLAELLSRAGHEAKHLADLGLTGAADIEIWRHAMTARCVIITKDQDFAMLRGLEPDGPAVVWMRWGNTRKTALLQSLRRTLPVIIAALERGEKLVELV
ncbi:MAG: hypothetical protein F9K44_14615 [Hyphomicrobiaceae bacterium]|nr:MAG: hypothetical protein F9K44_14615 [Hyphomicrobiaceae bacterium]